MRTATLMVRSASETRHGAEEKDWREENGTSVCLGHVAVTRLRPQFKPHSPPSAFHRPRSCRPGSASLQ